MRTKPSGRTTSGPAVRPRASGAAGARAYAPPALRWAQAQAEGAAPGAAALRPLRPPALEGRPPAGGSRVLGRRTRGAHVAFAYGPGSRERGSRAPHLAR
eukprot:9195037-Alexandrium_andersonii.AAC.1